jgi:chromosome segregation ATPase
MSSVGERRMDDVVRKELSTINGNIQGLSVEIKEMRKALTSLLIVEERLDATRQKAEGNTVQINNLWKTNADNLTRIAGLETRLAVIETKSDGNHKVIWWMMAMTASIIVAIIVTSAQG